MQITFSEKINLNILVIGLAEEFNLSRDLELDHSLEVLIDQIAKFRKFEGKIGQKISVATPHHVQIKSIILVGLGKFEDFSNISATKFAGKVISGLKCARLESASIILENRIKNEAAIYANVAFGAKLRDYSFDKYKSLEKIKDKIIISEIELVTSFAKEAEDIFKRELNPVAESIKFSRDLISEPPNIIYPETFCNAARKELEDYDIKIEVLGEADMHALGMNAILGVGQGSSKESKLLVMTYNGGKKDEAPIAFVGKGVTFDTGGISIKPSANMEDMKYDMSGASIVTGVIRALAARRAKVNIVAIAGLVENMPDGNAQRPADVVKSMSGQTIEILNTDAEGRLVLADALWYCQDRFKPKMMIDLATLTGAIIVSLGTHYAGLFSNDKNLTDQLMESGKLTEEKLWEFPLGKEYDQMIDSVIADVRNTGNGKGAGSITAAQFLQRFVNNVTWAHLDIAGVSWADKDSDLHPTGATGFGVRLLNEFVKKYEH